MRPHDHSPATARPASDEPIPAAGTPPPLPPVDCIQVLEVRGDDGERPVTITAAIAADAIQAICTALSEQLDRYSQARTEHAEEVLTLREHTALVERLEPLAAGEGHAVFSFSRPELRRCLLELMRYVERVDAEHYQAPDLRARVRVIRYVIPVLWEANTAAAAASEEPSRGVASRLRR